MTAGNCQTAGAEMKMREADEKLTRLHETKAPYEKDRKCGGCVAKKAGPQWPLAKESAGA